MASLILATGWLIHNKIKDKKEAKKAKKTQMYQDRYDTLEQEHKSFQQQEKGLSKQTTLDGENSRVTQQQDSPVYREKRTSSESQRSDSAGDGGRRRRRSSLGEEEDNPSKWVDEVVKERSQANVGGAAAGGRQLL